MFVFTLASKSTDKLNTIVKNDNNKFLIILSYRALPNIAGMGIFFLIYRIFHVK